MDPHSVELRDEVVLIRARRRRRQRRRQHTGEYGKNCASAHVVPPSYRADATTVEPGTDKS
ncbi:hypothetical protein C731_4934 [Mycolicibacterium hassiacum DSM 44199]|uniref:Uncharacterized protein n=1 Tax=Mycolicibacterium hassiacum (strain DSM 44199 / CIP 105218 / JCM 12690 / 3849) TaxID=1122247 RepID=K5BBY4_MYCHD|nr:hypothetical protein C731_4934 [Mycolicibacterium hassiacum DSM 44199]